MCVCNNDPRPKPSFKSIRVCRVCVWALFFFLFFFISHSRKDIKFPLFIRYHQGFCNLLMASGIKLYPSCRHIQPLSFHGTVPAICAGKTPFAQSFWTWANTRELVNKHTAKRRLLVGSLFFPFVFPNSPIVWKNMFSFCVCLGGVSRVSVGRKGLLPQGNEERAPTISKAWIGFLIFRWNIEIEIFQWNISFF